MKIGILTFYKGINHGATLQAYATYSILKDKGHDVELIAYRNKFHLINEVKAGFFTYRFSKFLNNAIKWVALSKFSKTSFVQTSNFYSPKKLEDLNYDFIIIGSDIVWCFKPSNCRPDPVYFGLFNTKSNLIAYAPSIGNSDSKIDDVPDFISKGLSRFKSIAVRDYVTQKFVFEQIGINVPLVLDPTLLLNTSKLNARCNYTRFILIYAFGQFKKETIKKIKEFCTIEGLTTIAVGYTQSWCDINKSSVGIEEWLGFFKDATYVITGTFHGTLFSILYRKQFCTIENDKINCKLEYIIDLLKLRHRMVSSSLLATEVLKQIIDYNHIYSILEPEKERSINYIFENLNYENN